MAHQLEGLRRSNGRAFYAYFMEQGTGKTWTTLADAERAYASGMIDAMLVFAPKGVHTNWVRREIPMHFDAPCIARAWRTGVGKKEFKYIEEVMTPRKHGEAVVMRILAMNIDSVNTKNGFDFAERFLNATKAMIVVDESRRIGNMQAMRTKQLFKLRRKAAAVRILSGTPITQGPTDLFSQFEFMKSGLLGTTSYRAFFSEYAELTDIQGAIDKQNQLAEAKKIVDALECGDLSSSESLQCYQLAVARVDVLKANMTRDDYKVLAMHKKNPRIAFAQIPEKDSSGNTKWRNLDRLQKLIEPHSYRVLKKDCLDLPPKVYKNVYFDMLPKQREAYELMAEEARIQLDDGDILSVHELAALVKMQQITSGFVKLPSGDIQYVAENNPRLETLLDVIEDIDGKIIIWARFREEIAAIVKALRDVGRKVVEYHGGIKPADREIAVDSLQKGDAGIFVGQAQSGGIGLTLTAAETTIYFSNDFNNETRLQSEDRNHRMGTINHIRYIDLVATDSIDEKIASALQRKSQVASIVLDGGKHGKA
jgi:SNF2 family DNA or RNA helicase